MKQLLDDIQSTTSEPAEEMKVIATVLGLVPRERLDNFVEGEVDWKRAAADLGLENEEATRKVWKESLDKVMESGGKWLGEEDRMGRIEMEIPDIKSTQIRHAKDSPNQLWMQKPIPLVKPAHNTNN